MTSYYTDLPFMARSSCSYCMDLPFLVDSIDSSAVRGQLQFFRSMHLSSLYYLCAAYDGFRLKSSCTQTVAETVLKSPLHLFTCSSFIHFRRISNKCSSWRMLTEFQQDRQSRVGQSFAVELQDFMKANARKACAVVKI